LSSTGLSFDLPRGKAFLMEKKREALTREERLAAKLRENLRRRKAQARTLEQGDNHALPKRPTKS
jgi:hypothetical protein